MSPPGRGCPAGTLLARVREHSAARDPPDVPVRGRILPSVAERFDSDHPAVVIVDSCGVAAVQALPGWRRMGRVGLASVAGPLPEIDNLVGGVAQPRQDLTDTRVQVGE